MNKEHFLIELKIYLRPLSNQQQSTILTKYERLFDERLAAGETEEQIAKSLEKPKVIAEAILQEFDIAVPEKPLGRDGWQEITPVKKEVGQFEYGEYYTPETEEDHPYNNNQRDYLHPTHSPFVRFCQIAGILCLNFFLMIWLIFSAVMLFFSFWLVAILFLFSPILGAYSVFSGFTAVTAFQLFLSIFLSGLGIIGLLILAPLTKFFGRMLRRYFQWNIAIFRGEV